MSKLYDELVSPFNPDLLITDDRSIFQSKEFVDSLFKRARDEDRKEANEAKNQKAS